jgi:hypothetical protein
MKRLLCLLTILIAASCDSEKGTDPVTKAELQAPFGNGEVDVKLKKVLFNGLLEVEYVYAGNVLAEERRYISSPAPLFSQHGIFKRNNGRLETYEALLRPRETTGANPADTLKPYFTLTYSPPVNDTLRFVLRQDGASGTKSNRIIALDESGFITRQDYFYGDSGSPTTVYYVRDEKHNISKTWTKTASNPMNDEVRQLYDDHPNPFFKLGMDAYGEMSVKSLSPNNVTQETFYAGGVPKSNTYYVYEYLPDGYPKKVTVRVESVNFPPYSYTMDFIY